MWLNVWGIILRILMLISRIDYTVENVRIKDIYGSEMAEWGYIPFLSCFPCEF